MLENVDTQLYTAEDLWQMEGDFELDRGTLVEMTSPGVQHGILCARIAHRLMNWSEQGPGGFVTSNDAGFVLRRRPDTVRGPDVSWLSPARRGEVPEVGWVQGGPDLAVEVLSPGDRPGEVRRKVGDYLDAGTRLVWVFDQRHRTIEVYEVDGPVRVLRVGEVLEGGALLPGFTWPLAEIYGQPSEG